MNPKNQLGKYNFLTLLMINVTVTMPRVCRVRHLQGKVTTMNIVLMGATGGIGSALLQQLLQIDGCKIIATFARRQPPIEAPNLSWFHFDLAQPDDPQILKEYVDGRLDSIDLWVCATGYLDGPLGGPEKSLRALQSSKLAMDFAVNASGPMLCFAACERGLRKADRPVAVFLSAQVGSIEDNRSGGWYGYRMSKAALNMGVKCAAIEALRWRNDACIVAVHPGTTLTNLSEKYVAKRTSNLQTAEVCADQLVALIESIQPATTGALLRLNGETIPW